VQLIIHLRESKYAEEKLCNAKKENVDNYQVANWCVI
jgi:hypothetical protein